MKPNALLAKPERRFHQLVGGAKRFRDIMGRAPREEDYEGVHTTTNLTIAAAYAMSAWTQSDFEGYPLVLELDVSGLEPQPDVDAILQGLGTIMEPHIRKEVADILQERGGWEDATETDLDRIRALGERAEFVPSAEVGDEPAAFVFESVPRDPIAVFIDWLDEHLGDDDENKLVALTEWAVFGKPPPPAVLSAMVEQQRYLADLNIDRLIRVVAFQPWWHTVFGAYWDMDDPDLEAEAQAIEEAGWRLVTIDDVSSGDLDIGPTKTLYERPGGGSGEFHGTTSLVIAKAFPEVSLPVEPSFLVDTTF